MLQDLAIVMHCVAKSRGAVVVLTKSDSTTSRWVTDCGWLRGRWSHILFLHADVTRFCRVSETRRHASCKYRKSSLSVTVVSVTEYYEWNSFIVCCSQ